MSVNKDRLRKTFLDLVMIPSPSRNERAVADEIIKRVKDLGYTITEDDAAEKIEGNCGNLLMDIPATGKGDKLFLSAHIDTVEDGSKTINPLYCDDGDYVVTTDGVTILGADDKTGVAAILELLEIIKEKNIKHGGLKIAFTVAEEKEALGAQEIDSEFYLDCDAGIALDHSYPNEVIVAAPTKIAMQVAIHGTGGHAAFPEQRINAASVMARVLSRLPSKRMDEFSTANIGIIYSGTAINVIPDLAYAEYEIRSHKDDLLDFHLSRTLATIEATVREARVYLNGPSGGIGDDAPGTDPVRKATVEVDVITCYTSYHLENGSKPVEVLKGAIESCGQKFSPVIAQGGSDANIFNAKGLPSAVLGCGMHGVHSVTETANISETASAVEILLQAIGE